MTHLTRQSLKILERTCFGLGAMGLILFSGAMLQGAIASAAALKAFEIEGSAQGETEAADRALAVLEIARLNVRVPVFIGTDPSTLNKGAGIVEGTALPGEVGNIAVAAHRDSHFRPLEHILIGDLINLRTTEGEGQFEVTEVRITDPLDISVLDDTEEVMLTLITCYPFHYVGFAPDRYVIRALPVREAI